MLTKRTNILFSEEMWKQLTTLAKERNASVGEVVRFALEQTYLSDKKQNRVAVAFHNIIEKRPLAHRGINYKALINEGRNE